MRYVIAWAFIAFDIWVFWQWLALQHTLKNCIEWKEVVYNNGKVDKRKLALLGW